MYSASELNTCKWQISGRQFGQHFRTTFTATALSVTRTFVIWMPLCSEKKFKNCSTCTGLSSVRTANATGRPTPLPSSTSRVNSMYLSLFVCKPHNIYYFLAGSFHCADTVYWCWFIAGFFFKICASDAKNAGKYAEFVKICTKNMQHICWNMWRICGKSSDISAYAIFKTPKYLEKYAIYAAIAWLL